MLESIGVENFKSLKKVEIDFKPLTILVGANCSGKSSLIQALLLMKQTIANRDDRAPLILRGDYVDLGAYQDLITDREISNSLVLKLKVKLDRPIHLGSYFGQFFLPDIYLKSTNRVTVDINFDFSESNNNIYVNYLAYTDGETGKLFFEASPRRDLEEEGKYARYVVRVPTGIMRNGETAWFEFTESTLKNFIGCLSSSGLNVDEKYLRGIFTLSYGKMLGRRGVKESDRRDFPKEYLEEIKRSIDTAYSRALYQIRRKVESQLLRLIYLGPIRKVAQRFYIASGVSHPDVGIKGELAIDILHLESVEKRRELGEKISWWLRKFNMAKSIKFEHPHVKDMSSSIPKYLYAFNLENKKTGTFSPVANQGFGVSQVLPLIVQGFYSPKGTTLLVEQPEIHLHPSAQFKLADLLVAISRKKVNLVVETHSEYIIRRLQSLVARWPKLRDQIAIYLFSMQNRGTYVRKLKLNKKGQTVNWPAYFKNDFLDGAFWESQRQLDAIIEQEEEITDGEEK